MKKWPFFTKKDKRVNSSSARLRTENCNHVSYLYVTNDWNLINDIYQSSAIVGRIIDTYTNDMTRKGIEIIPSDDYSINEIDQLQKALKDIYFLENLQNALRWAILYGGSTIVIDDGNTTWNETIKPVYKENIRDLSFYIYDRWRIMPSTIYNFDYDNPTSWQIIGPQSIGEVEIEKGRKKLQYDPAKDENYGLGSSVDSSRVIKIDGLVPLPWIRRQMFMGWGLSIIERMMDQVVNHEKAITHSTSLLKRANTRVLLRKGLNESLATLGASEFDRTNLQSVLDNIAYTESNMDILLLDGEDNMVRDSYTFSGLPDMIKISRDEICMASAIPYSRLFGFRDGGLWGSSESDLQEYYESIQIKQNQNLKKPYIKILQVLCKMLFDRDDIPEFNFVSLWEMNEKEKSEIVTSKVNAILGTLSTGVLSDQNALIELKNLSKNYGIFSSITDEDIDNASEDAPRVDQDNKGEEDEEGSKQSQKL